MFVVDIFNIFDSEINCDSENIFLKNYFESEKILFFSELNFFWGYSFDVKNCDLSMYDVFSAF